MRTSRRIFRFGVSAESAVDHLARGGDPIAEEGAAVGDDHRESLPGRRIFVRTPRRHSLVSRPNLLETLKMWGGGSALVVDDDVALRRQLRQWIAPFGVAVDEAATVEAALVRARGAAVVFLDLRLKQPSADRSGFDVLRALRGIHRSPRVVVMSAHYDTRDVYTAFSLGAIQYLVKGGTQDDPAPPLERQIVSRYVREFCVRPSALDAMIGSSEAMSALRDRIGRLALGTDPITVTGEPGTGKELVAQAIHECSDRRDAALVAFNAAALPDNLVERELFGHEAGAFTGAVGDSMGRFAEASGGTIFLDEIGDMPLAQQAKLLRVIETGVVRPLGSTKDIIADARVVAATNADLDAAVINGKFRSDLRDRICALRIDLPPLRARGAADIDELVEHFAEDRLQFTSDARNWLRSYDWPGNVRQLRAAIRKLILLVDGVVDVPTLEREVRLGRSLAKASPNLYRASFDECTQVHWDRFTRGVIKEAVRASNGNLSEAGRRIGLSYKVVKRLAR